LRKYYANVDKYLADFRSYRVKVPTYGAILMNKELTQVLLVQGFRNQWGFPKGKVNENEDPVECAIREVRILFNAKYNQFLLYIVFK
jgi:mRNA-decapping enzyme subunit 2